jgi:hypothetical protein
MDQAHRDRDYRDSVNSQRDRHWDIGVCKERGFPEESEGDCADDENPRPSSIQEIGLVFHCSIQPFFGAGHNG